jgi:hypothetical protein
MNIQDIIKEVEARKAALQLSIDKLNEQLALLRNTDAQLEGLN